MIQNKEKKYPKTSDIFQINLMSAGSCNLDCKFCFLYKNDAYRIFNKEVREAWQSGSYVSNLKKVFRRLESDPSKIRSVEFWGGETLLQIEDVTPNLKELFAYFPYVKEIRISTNWCIKVNNFIDFLTELDKVLDHHLELRLQLSIDGLSGEPLETGHKGTPELYRKNIEEFCYYFNNHKLRNLFIKIYINANIKKDVYFKLFSTEEGIKSYIEEMTNFCKEIKELCVSRNIDFCLPTVFPGYALPTLDTVQDGLRYSEILNLWNYVYKKYFHNQNNEILDDSSFLLGSMSISSTNIMNDNSECSELRGSRTILPDGTIVCCTGCYIYGRDYSEEYLLKENNMNIVRQGRIFKSLEYNPITATDEELENVEWYISSGVKHNKKTHLMYNFALAKELARAGQISRSYLKDDDSLLRDVCTISRTNACHKENILLSNNLWIQSPGVFRRYLNGVTESQIRDYELYK